MKQFMLLAVAVLLIGAGCSATNTPETDMNTAPTGAAEQASDDLVYPEIYANSGLSAYPEATVTEVRFLENSPVILVESDFEGREKPETADKTNTTMTSSHDVETVYNYYATELEQFDCEVRSSDSLPFTGSHDCITDAFHISVNVGPASGGGSQIIIGYNDFN